MGRKDEIRDPIRKGKSFAERKKCTRTFDELVQKYREIVKDQKCLGRAKKFALKSIEKYFFKEDNQRTRFLTEEEMRNLLAVDYKGGPMYLKPIIATAIYTALRKGRF